MNRREPRGYRANLITNRLTHLSLYLCILFSFLSFQVDGQDCTIPPEGFALICESPSYYTFIPNEANPPDISPCPTLLNDNPITFDCEGSAYDPGNPPTISAGYYVWQGNDLYVIDPTVPCGQNNVTLVGSNLISGAIAGSTLSFDMGMATLWVVNDASPSILYEINPATGTVISSKPLQDCNGGGLNAVTEFSSIAYDPVGDRFIGLNVNSPEVIYNFNTTDGCVFVCATAIFLGIPNPPNLEADGLSVGPDGTFYVSGDSDDDLGAKAIYSFMLPTCAIFQLPPDSIVVATYNSTIGDLGTVAMNGTACLQECPIITCAISNITDASCSDTTDGRATATATGGTAPYTYLWSNNETTQTAVMLSPGVPHSVTITDANDCEVICDDFTVGSPLPLTCTVNLEQANLCVSENIAELSVSIQGGTFPYFIMWSNNESTSSINDLMPGLYTANIRDSNGCTTSCSFEVLPAPSFTCATQQISDVTCNGLSDGSASVVTFGGIAPFTYFWSSGESTQTAIALDAGLASVTVTDANQCETICQVAINQPTELQCSVTLLEDIICAEDLNGSAEAVPTGGTGPYTYLWDNGETTAVAVMLDGGQHTVTVTDTNMCTTTCMITISDTSDLSCFVSLVQNVSCNGLDDGSATVNPTGGIPAYTYLWDNNETTPTAIALSAGLHEVTVTDQNNCATICTINILEPVELSCSVTVNADLLCFGENIGSATAVVSGGTDPYQYLWDDGQMTQTATGLDDGAVSVTITDDNGCVTVCNGTITSPEELTCLVTPVSDISCFGEVDGSALAVPTGGVSPYTYLWSNAETEATATALPLGPNTVSITDANMCVTTCTIVIQEPDELTCVVNKLSDTLCEGETNGSGQAVPAGGTGPYTYLWNNGETTATAVMLDVGIQTVVVTDANGCTTSCTVNIFGQSTLACTIQQDNEIECAGDMDAALTVTATGGNMPYTYSWSTNATTQSVMGLGPGDYSVTVTDANGCTNMCMFTVAEPPALICSIDVLQAVACFGDSNGSATMTGSGGTPAYSYLWDNNETTVTAIALTAGLHTATITDANGCMSTCTVDIPSPPELTCSTTLVSNITCAGDNDGSASAVVVGGTPIYTFLWSTGETTATAVSLIPGVNTVTVTDANLCETICTINITEPQELLCSVTKLNDTLCEGETNGSGQTIPTGGTEPYTYLWNNGETTATAVMLDVGIQTVVVTDANGCTTSCTVNILGQSTLECSIEQDNFIDCLGDMDAALTVTATGGNMPYTYSWSTNSTTQSVMGLGPGDFTVTVTDANGCTTTCMFTVTEPTILTCSIDVLEPVACFGDANGSATITGTGGTPAYSYLWDNNETAETAIALTAGLHTATITDANGCTNTCTVDVPGPTELTCSTTLVNNISCFGISDGSATAVVVGGTPIYSFLWSTGETTATAVSLIPGVNTVTVTDANLCETICTIDIDEPQELLCSITKLNDTLCEGESNGSAEAMPTGGTGPFSYLWDNGETDAVANMLNAGIHTVTVTDVNDCVTTCTIEIAGQSTLACTIQQENFIECFDDMDAVITVTPTGGNMPYTYSWSTGASSQTIMGLGPGDYTATVIDNNGCTTFCMITVTEPPALSCSIDINQGVACFGDTNGSATITGIDGTPGYTYLWDNNEETATAVALSAGMHTATITDVNGCMSTCSVDIPGPPELTCSTTLINNITCFGDDDGSATAIAMGGTAAYTFLWSNGETTATANALVPGLNSVTVTDTNGCATDCTINIIEPPLLTCTVALVNDVLCAGESNGSATVITNNGVSPFTYLWDNNESTATATMLSVGTHTVTVTDDTGCITSCTIEIMDQTIIQCLVSLDQNVSCAGGNDGAASVAVVGGVEPYTYAWSNSETAVSAVALTAGANSVTVTDANGCTTTCDIVIIEPTALICSTTLVNDISCFGDNDGSATVTASEGTPDYTFLWDNGQTVPTATGLTPGLHTVTVTDANDCQTICDITINEPDELTCSLTLVNNISCFGANDGSATIVTSGGTPTYAFLWDDGQTTASAVGLTPGLHSATVTDTNNCSTTCEITLVEPVEFTCSIVLVNDVLCAGDVNGSATVTPTGGVAPFTYLWDNNETNATAVMLSGGGHTVTITDATNCTTSCEIVIMDQSTLQCTSTLVQDVSCNGGVDGSASAVAVGGVGPFTYIWDNGETTSIAVNLDAGIHTVTVNDTNNCGTTCTVVISEPLILGCSAGVINNISCFGDDNGSAIANPIGGTSPYSYLWDNGQTTQIATGLTPGLHDVTVTDMNLCETICSVTINEPQDLLCTINLINDISCFGENDGSAEVLAEGGTPIYSILWDDGQTSSTAVGLTPGNHIVTVTDLQNCTTTCSITIFEPVVFSCSVNLVNNVLCQGEVNGSATVVTSGGVAPFTYLWDNNETTQTAEMLASGAHTVTVTDNTGCTTVCTINIMDQITLACTLTIEKNVSCIGEMNGSALATPVGGVGPYTYLWSNSEQTQIAVNLVAGVNSVTVTDDNGCTTSCEIIITEPALLECAISLDNNISCFGLNDGSATVTPEGGTPEYSYLWDDGQTTTTAINLTPGLHTVTVTDANLCISTCDIIILEPTELSCAITVINDISCFGENDGSATIAATGGTPGYTYLWDDGQTTQTGINLNPGLHTATVTDANSCTTVCSLTINEPEEFTCIVTLVNDVLCAGDVNGSATAVETGGIGPFTYLWDNNESTQTAVMLSGGNHAVTITDATGCTTECEIEIMDQSTLQCTISLVQDVSCNGDMDGSATASAVGGVGPFTYDWDNGETTATAISLNAGTHTVTVNDTNNCGTTCTILIGEPPLYSCSIALENDVTCFGVNDGSATVTATGGTPGYTYLWDNNQSEATATDLTPGMHVVTVTDANGCETICSININEPLELTCSMALENDISCFGANDGSATVTASNGTPGYTYLWDDGQTTETAINLSPGLHIVTVTDANSCMVLCDITIQEPADFTCMVILVNDVFCAGDINGSATVVPTNGIAPFTFLWDNNEVTATAEMLSGGNHTITVTDATGCTTVCSIEIMDQSTLECSITLIQDVSCNGGSDGSAMALQVGGVGPFTYAWDNGETTATAIALDAGIHTVTVNDLNNCGTTCTIDVAEPPIYSCSITKDNDISCFGANDGTATVIPVGGTPGYTFLWDDGQTTETASGLTPGPHTVTVTDANACETICDIIINEPIELTCSISLINDISCFGDDNGSATISALGGVSGYTYLWDDGQTTETASDLTPGLHTATVTDASACTTVCSITINEPAEFTCSVTLVNNVLCAGDTNGSATAIVSGGIGPFSYLWDNGEITPTATMLSGGSHTITLTDGTGCTTFCSIDIMDQSTLQCMTTLEANVSCQGGSNGSATATSVGGVGPFTYNWDNGETTATAVNLDAGTHTVTVNDTNNCGTTCTIDIVEPPAISCSITKENDISCFGANDGSATVVPEGGTPGYTYLWDDGQTSETAINLTPGSHTVTVTDANACETVCDIVIDEPIELSCTITLINDISCFGDDNGSATLVASGGVPEYTYLWDDGQTIETAINLTPGLHTATVTDASGCTTVCSITIDEPAEFTCSVTLINNVFCAGDTNGSAIANESGGIGPFSYLWDNGETTATATLLSGGNHTITITDGTGCSTVCSIEIMDQSTLQCDITLESDVSCHGGTNGSATATSVGGVGPFSYSWDNGETTATAVNLDAGTHTVTVNDTNNCGTTCTIDIAEPPVYSCTVTKENDISCFGSNDGSATVVPDGGTPGYTYLWDDGQITETATNLTPGIHTVTVTDANACETICDITIDEPIEMTCSISLVNDISCFGEDDGSATIIASGGLMGYTYLWDDGQTTETAVDLTPGLHTATVTDSSDCTTICSITINEPAEFTCTVTLINNVFCAGDINGSATAVESGGIGPFTYLWDNGESIPTATMLSGGNHTVTITDATACTTVCSIEIMDQSTLQCDITLETDVSCAGGSNGSATATSVGGVGPFSYMWDNGETTATAVNLDAGTHTVTVNDTNNCGTTCTIDIAEPPTYSCSIILENEISCFGANDASATVSAEGGTPGYTYLWDNNQTTTTATNLTPGTHMVTVTDANSCETICEIFVAEPAELLCVIQVDNQISCFGEDDGSASITVTGGSPDYTYLWDNGQTTATAINLTPGVHSATITDSSLCTTECSVTIIEPASFTCTVDIVSNVQCAGDTNGSATASPIGGVAPFTFRWDNDELTQTAVMLDGGMHIVTITDASGCTTECEVIILDQSGLSCEITLVNDISCFGTDDGSATVQAMGGAGNYTYLWDNNESTQTAVNLGPGFHEVTVTDINDCGTICNITILEPTLISLTDAIAVTSLTCSGNDDGTATITATGGTPPYTYEWSNGETQQMAVALPAGIGRVTVTDVNQCTLIEEFTIESPDFPVVIIDNITPITCPNFFAGTSNDGAATATVTGGIPGYMYAWSSGETTATATMLVAGLNTVTVTDAFGCVTVEEVDIAVENCFRIDLEKTVEFVNPEALVQVGSELAYSFKVCNIGTVSLEVVTISDPLITVGGGPINLAPGVCDESAFSGLYTITQLDIDRRFVSNTATAMGFDVINNNPVSASSDDPFTSEVDDATVITLQAPSISLEKVADISGLQSPAEPGDIIRYEFTICNTGDLILNTVNIIDVPINIVGTALSSLAPGVCDETSFTGNYTITSTDIALGFVENSAMVTSIDPEDNLIEDRSDDPFDLENIDPNGDGNPDDPTIVLLEAVPNIELFKVGTVVSDCPLVGDLITYTFEVCNTGNVDLSGIMVTDDLVSVMGGPLALEAGECNNTSFVASYVLTQDDIDRGFVENSAMVEGADANGTRVSDLSDDPNDATDLDTEGDGEADDVTLTTVIQKGDIVLTKTGEFNDESGDGIAQPGETISYMFSIVNTGNVTLTNVIVDDPIVSISGQAIPTLPVGGQDSLSFTGNYTLIGSDIDIALVDNTAQVTASGPTGQIVAHTSDSRVEYIVRTCDEIICNNDLSVSLGASCELDLNEDQLLEDPVFGNYVVELFEDDEPFGVGGLLTQESIGKTLTYQVSCGLNSCWGTVTVEANRLPEFDSPCITGPNGEINPDCIFACRDEERPNQILSEEEVVQILSSPCTPNLVGNLIVNETTDGDLCSENGTLVTIVYSGKFTIHGNTTEKHVLTQTYTIIPIGVDEIIFPSDITLNCNSSTDPSVIAAILQNNQFAFPTVFDDNYVPKPDSMLQCDSTRIEIILGTREVMELQIIDGKELWTLVTIVEKMFDYEIDSTSCRMVVDPESFEEVRFIPLDERYCNLISSYSDVEFPSCGNTKKILRDWQVIDWCSPDISRSSSQTIETNDKSSPRLLSLLNDVFVYIEPWSCTGVYNLPQLTSGINYFEFCGGQVDIEWDTEEGRVVDGAIVDLWFTNDPIRVTATYTDECGNKTSNSFRIIMQDLTRPVMVCNTNVQVLLTGTNDNGSATLFAADLDEGSHDAGCGLVDLQIIRAEDYEDPIFNCEGELLGYEPVTCGVLTQEINAALINGNEKNSDCSDSLRTEVSLAGNFVTFCCADVGQSVEVIVIATDKHGNTNSCRVEVLIGEQLLPRLVCPTVEVDCSSDEMIFPQIEGSVCAIREYEPILIGEVNGSTNCVDATISREWYIDLNANGLLDDQDPYCQQHITIAGQGGILDPFTIKWPKNYDGTTHNGINIECDDDEPKEQVTQVPQGASMECIAEQVSSGPVWCHTNCSLVGTSLVTDTISSSEACLTIIKRWTVVDWCSWDSNQSDIDDENDHAADTFEAVEDWAQFNCDDCQHSNVWTDNIYFRYKTVDTDGYYTFDQIIKIEDQTGPEILAPLSYIVSTSSGANSKDDDASCVGSEIVTVRATDTCGGESANAEDLTWTIIISKDGDEIATKSAKGHEVSMNTQEGQPGDVHTIVWIAQDPCGNQSSISTIVEFGDEAAPTPFCVTSLTSNLPDGNGDVIVWSNEFDFGSFDNCTSTDDLRFSIVPMGVEPIRPGEAAFETQNSIQINCDDSSQLTELDMWVWDTSGNGDFCSVRFGLSESCDDVQVGSSGTLAGKITTPSDEDMSEVAITLSAELSEYPKSEQSNANGQYAFFNNPTGINYTITPKKDGYDTNGLSTVDLVFIQRHIVGISKLDNPYKVIAADANNDQKISARDILELRKLILTYQDEFSNSDSWRFVDKNQEFFETNSPWPFIEDIALVNLEDSRYGLDFIAVKIGDINFDADVNGIKGSEIRYSASPFQLLTNNQTVTLGDIVNVDILTNSFSTLHGLQFTLHHEGFELISINSEAMDVEQSNYAAFDGYTTFSWNSRSHALNFVDGAQLFSIVFKATKSSVLQDQLKINSSKTNAEAYLNDIDMIAPVELTFNSTLNESEKFELYQNQPNPFNGNTVISFNLPEESKAEIILYTISGQVVKSLTGEFLKGYNELIIDSDRLPVSGILYYQLQTEFGTKTMKMIVLD